MLAFLLRRLAATVLLLFLVTVTVFGLGHLTGDPVRLMMPEDASSQDIEAMRKELGFDRPLPVQFGAFLANAVQGDLGTSIRYQQPALELALGRMPATIELSVAAMAIAVVVALPLGVISAVKAGGRIDALVSMGTVIGQALAPFWIGIMLIVVFAVWLPWFPVAGRGPPESLVLPAVTLSLWPLAKLARIFRSSLIDQLTEDYVRTARARGLGEGRVIIRHVLRNAAIPLVTVAGLTFGLLLGGTVVIESVFAWPGIGRLALEAVSNRDFPVVQAAVLVAAIVFVGINFILDVAYSLIDPRIRVG